MDLLSPEEERRDSIDACLRFDLSLLLSRLEAATDYMKYNCGKTYLNIGYFGSSTGGGEALMAAAGDSSIKAVVSRGGRPDLADERALKSCTTNILLLVGSRDQQVLKLNEHALDLIKNSSLLLGQQDLHQRLTVIPSATHLFEEPGTLNLVSAEASKFFAKQFH